MSLYYVTLCCYLFCVGVLSVMAVEAPLKVLNDGNQMPTVALGTGRGTSMGTPIDEVRQAVYWAIEAGYRHIDTASIYEDEPQVGLGIKDAIEKGLVKREELFVTTKLWNDRHAQAQVVPALRESLTRLGLDYVDLYLVHFPIAVKMINGAVQPDDIDYLDTWKGMEEAKTLGLAKSIGVSNFNASQIDRLVANSKIKPAVNQIEVNPTLTQEELVAHCQQLQIAVMAYSPFGFLVTRRTTDAIPPTSNDPALLTMAKKYEKSTAQIVLKYLVQRGLTPIPKSTNKDRIAKNIDLFDFELTDEEMNTISKFNRNVRVISMSNFKDYPHFPFVQY